MSDFSNIVNDTLAFPSSSLTKGAPVDWSQGVTAAAVKQAVKNLLSEDFKFVERDAEPTGVPVYDELSKILPFNEKTAFFWRSTVYPTASMVQASGYSLDDQVAFVIYFYARTLGFMGKPHEFKSIMTVDGSPAEYTWHFPTKGTTKNGEAERTLAILLEPLHPHTSQQLHGTDVLEYLVSPQGTLGMVDLAEDSLTWRNEIEKFLYSSKPEGVIPDNRRYYLGFYVLPGAKISIKAYFLPPFRTPAQPDAGSRLHRRDPVFTPFRELLPRLDSSLLKPFNLVMDFFDEFEEGKGPTLLSCATDIVPVKDNRFKFYCHTATGLTLAHAQRFFRLNGRLNSKSFVEGVEVFADLWNSLFPEGNGDKDYDISELMHRDNREASSHHKVGGVLYYLDMKNGEDEPVTKIYIPIRNYLPNDGLVAQRIQVFCDKIGYKDPLNRGITDWVEKDVGSAFNHRPLGETSGLCCHISFALKRKGWEVGHYYSPENWYHLKKAHEASQWESLH